MKIYALKMNKNLSQKVLTNQLIYAIIVSHQERERERKMLNEFAEKIATKLIVRFGFEDKRTIRYIAMMERLGVLKC